jgi:hypothetical protein
MKTGTSAFAAHLSHRADHGDLPDSLIYPSGDLWFPRAGSITKHHDLVELAPMPPANALERRRETSATPELIREKLAAIAAEAHSRKGSVTVVMVCEIADQKATPELGSVLREYFDRVDFVIVAREQSSALRSLMGQQIRMWKRREILSTDPDQYLLKQRRLGSYDYAALWQKWNISTGDFAIHFVPYRDGSGTDDLSQDIFDSVGAGTFPHSDTVLNGERIHGNFTAEGMRQLTAVKRIAHNLRAIPGADALGKYLFGRIVARLHAEVQRGEVSRERTWRFSPADEAACRESYRESNIAFRTALGAEAKKAQWVAWFDRALGEKS